MNYLLSILIPTLPGRKAHFNNLKENLTAQLIELGMRSAVEIIEDSRIQPITTGEKRNYLLQSATGKYVWFIDDDDDIEPGAIAKVLAAALKQPDVIAINGYMTTDGAQRVDWEIRLGHPYKAIQKDGHEYYLRHPNHITPMRRDLAIQVQFPHKNQREDYEWAVAMLNTGLLKTQEIIDEPVYHYKYITNK